MLGCAMVYHGWCQQNTGKVVWGRINHTEVHLMTGLTYPDFRERFEQALVRWCKSSMCICNQQFGHSASSSCSLCSSINFLTQGLLRLLSLLSSILRCGLQELPADCAAGGADCSTTACCTGFTCSVDVTCVAVSDGKQQLSQSSYLMSLHS